MARSVITESPLSTPVNPSWMSRPWRVLSCDDAGLGVAATETLLFAAPGKVQILTDGKTQDWGKSCKVTAEGLSGLTLDNRPFLIQYQTANGKGRLTCKVQPPPNPMYKANDGTWVAEEGGPGTVEPPPHVGDHGPAKG